MESTAEASQRSRLIALHGPSTSVDAAADGHSYRREEAPGGRCLVNGLVRRRSGSGSEAVQKGTV